MAFDYPKVKREDVCGSYHNVKIPDPYRWLENPDSEETKQFVEAQNAITMPYINQCPYKESINKSLTKLWNYPKYSPPTRHGDKYYQYRNTGLQNQNVIFQMDTLKSEAKVFFDPNLLSDDGTVALSQTKFSEDGKIFAYSLSESGSDWVEIRFKQVDTGENYQEVLKKVKFSPMCWMHDNEGFFYGAFLEQSGKTDGCETDSNEFQKLYYHKLGTEQSEDVVVVEYDDPQMRINAAVSFCGKYLIVTPGKGCKGNQVHFAYLNTNKISEKLKLQPIITEDKYEFAYITNNGSKFLFMTNKNALNYRLVYIDFENPDEANWVTLITENEKDVVNAAIAINNDKLVICYIKDVKHTLSLHKLESGEKIMDFNIDIGAINGITGKRQHDEMFFSFASFLTPRKIYKVDFKNDAITQTLFHETFLEDFDSTKFTSKQVFYKSKDGTEIPMFIVSKKDFILNGSNPCLLYAYGGFNINILPSFSVLKIAFIKHFDGCFVVANIRGGGEYGDKWHDGGRFENKQNCFDDFQFAAKYLSENNYTNQNKLTILGGSNGGLLVAACINQTPQLFSAAVCQVGVLDMLRFHKFTIGYAWKSDYGSSEEKDQFEYLYKYSPLHNIKEPEGNVQYPATLLLTADHDDRVVPLHSFKFIAELQHKIGGLPKQKKPLMVRVETKAGHGAGKPTAKLIEEATDILCFVAQSCNLEFHV